MSPNLLADQVSLRQLSAVANGTEESVGEYYVRSAPRSTIDVLALVILAISIEIALFGKYATAAAPLLNAI